MVLTGAVSGGFYKQHFQNFSVLPSELNQVRDGFLQMCPPCYVTHKT